MQESLKNKCVHVFVLSNKEHKVARIQIYAHVQGMNPEHLSNV